MPLLHAVRDYISSLIQVPLIINNQEHIMEIDRVAALSIILKVAYKYLSGLVLNISKLLLKMYTWENLAVIGELDTQVQYN